MPLYFMVGNQSEARISTEHGINIYIYISPELNELKHEIWVSVKIQQQSCETINIYYDIIGDKQQT